MSTHIPEVMHFKSINFLIQKVNFSCDDEFLTELVSFVEGILSLMKTNFIKIHEVFVPSEELSDSENVADEGDYSTGDSKASKLRSTFDSKRT